MLQTTLAGSLPKPIWLAEPEKLWAPWKLQGEALEAGKRDATILSVKLQEDAGLDIVGDGEQARVHFVHGFLANLDGIDFAKKTIMGIRNNRYEAEVPTVTGPIRRKGPVEVSDLVFLKKHTRRKAKITLPGPFTMAQQAQDDYYKDEEALAMAFAAAVNEEMQDLRKAGADVIQLDEPWLQARPERAARYGVKAINRALQGIPRTTVVHLCFGYAAAVSSKPSGYSFLPQLADTAASQISIEAAQPRLDVSVLGELKGKTVMFGVIDLGTEQVETPQAVAERIGAALKVVPA